ncbi:MAG: polysaccharide deacetylase family protein [Bdellovibrionota bacterium]
MLLTILLSVAAYSADLSPELSQRIEHFAQANLRSVVALREFDSELNLAVSPGLLKRSSPYRQLLVLRDIKHSDAEAIGKYLDELQAKDPNAAIQAQLQLREKFSNLGSSSAALLEDISAHHEQLNLTTLLNTKINAQPAETKAASSPTLLDLEVAEVTSDMEFYPGTNGFDPEAHGAKPELPKIRPGAGPEGNITGLSFPENTWALTFDDGPHPKYTKVALDTLGQHHKKATFFWLAENVALKGNREAISLARAAGMSLNDHSYSHPDLSKATPEVLKHEIIDSVSLETREYGFKPEFFRCPYGAGLHSKNVREMIAENNMVHVFWNVDSLDWQDKDPAKILERVKKEMALEKKGIILFHDIHPQSVETAKLLLDYSDTLDHTEKQIRWVTLPEIRDELNRAQ